jgi:hypothetical protein
MSFWSCPLACVMPPPLPNPHESCLHPFLCHFVLVFFDDILIYRKTWQSHISHVDQILHLLSQQQIFLKHSKCAFGASEVEYLGHIFGKDGVRVNPKRIEAM